MSVGPRVFMGVIDQLVGLRIKERAGIVHLPERVLDAVDFGDGSAQISPHFAGLGLARAALIGVRCVGARRGGLACGDVLFLEFAVFFQHFQHVAQIAIGVAPQPPQQIVQYGAFEAAPQPKIFFTFTHRATRGIDVAWSNMSGLRCP